MLINSMGLKGPLWACKDHYMAIRINVRPLNINERPLGYQHLVRWVNDDEYEAYKDQNRIQ